MTDHGKLFKMSVDILDTFRPDDMAVDAQVAQFFNDVKCSENEKTFVVEVFAGCVRYRKALKVVVDGYYNTDGRTLLNSEANIYTVMAYLVLFRIDELGLDELNAFISVNSLAKMYKFFNFFTNEKYILTWMKDEWSRIYDNIFVQQELLLPFQRWLTKLQQLTAKLKQSVENKKKLKKTPGTEPKPFNLTKPRPRSIPVPEEIPTMNKARTVPSTLYKSPTEQTFISQQKIVNRKHAEDLLLEANKLQPSCATLDKSDKTIKKMEEIVQEREEDLAFDTYRANPVPNFQLNNRPIKLNAAAILREWKLYQDKESKQRKRLEALESGAFDASSFLKWQDEVRAQDLANELAEVERRRLVGKLSYEEAILARRRLEEANREAAVAMRAEAQARMEEVMEERITQEEALKRLAEAVLASHQNARLAKQASVESKKKIVHKMVEENRILKQQAIEEAEAELKRKMELIAEIRAMEATLNQRENFVDLSSVPGYGFLDEMSIIELKTRLAYLNEERERQNEEKRDSILREKEEQNRKLMETLEKIGKHRAEMSRAAAVKLEDKKRSGPQKQPQADMSDPQLDGLQRKLLEKKAERMQLQSQQKKSRGNEICKYAKEKKAIEEDRWVELEAAQERLAKLQAKGQLNSNTKDRQFGRAVLMS